MAAIFVSGNGKNRGSRGAAPCKMRLDVYTNAYLANRSTPGPVIEIRRYCGREKI